MSELTQPPLFSGADLRLPSTFINVIYWYVEILYVKIIKAALKVNPRFLARKIQINRLFVYFHRFKNSNYSILTIQQKSGLKVGGIFAFLF